MNDDELYTQFSNLIRTVPNLEKYSETRAQCDPWLAKSDALLNLCNDPIGLVDLRSFVSRFHEGRTATAIQDARKIEAIVLRNFYKYELKVSPERQSGFIAVGNQFDGYQRFTRILSEAKASAFVVDPYLDDTILTEFLSGIRDGIKVFLLADRDNHKSSLKVASAKWKGQYGNDRPLEVRLAEPKILHDRLIIVDSSTVWSSGQSFKDLAKRSPTALIEVDQQTADLKVSAYQSIWDSSDAL